MYDLIIIGGGPAGISAGIYSARQRLNTLLIAKSFGGQMTRKAVDIENYPGFEKISGLELIQKFEKHLRKNKIDIERDSVGKVKKINKDIFVISTASRKQFQAKTVIITSGADPRPLEVPGEKEFIGKGVSYCTACDGPLFADKEVAVIGGGNSGFEAALALKNYAKKIYILEFSPQVKAGESNQKLAQKSGIKAITNAALKKIQGEKFVDSIVYQDRKSKKLIILKVQGVFVEIGSQPATSFVKDLVDFSERDEIMIDPKTNMTKTPGLFAAGDVTNIRYKQIVIAAGEGAQAALSAYEYLQKL